MGRSRTRKRVSLGILFWFAFILFILVIFLFSRKNIQNVMEKTGLLDVVRTRVGLEQDTTEQEPAIRFPEDNADEPTPAINQTTDNNQPSDVSDEQDTITDITITQPEDGQEEKEEPAPAVEKRTAYLYYIRVHEDGSISTEKKSRRLPSSDSPLTSNIHALIQGPTAEDLNDGLLNLIPEGTRLLGASVQNRVAYLNFNEAFRFNPLGTEGIVAQLQQVILTATEFSSVDRVQFLINGAQIDYLGGDGVYIGQPLGRNSFR
ncbi:MAG: hypothetical protein D6B26_03835 [Spirochaetaceae bacterium]|nr:MAG: hypothetical protein D6B26_03835 [Spirochaetaceae bacterium]